MDTKADRVLAELQKEIKDGFREVVLSHFYGQENVKVRICHPTIDDELSIADRKSKIFNKLLKAGELLTRKQMLAKIEKEGIWTKEDDNNVESKRDHLRNIEVQIIQLKSIVNPLEKQIKQIEELDKEYNDTKIELLSMINDRESYLEHTVENKAQFEADLYKVILCTKFEDGKRVWETEDALTKDDKNRENAQIVREAMYFYNGVSQEALMLLPGDYVREQSQEVSETDQVAEDLQPLS